MADNSDKVKIICSCVVWTTAVICLAVVLKYSILKVRCNDYCEKVVIEKIMD